MTRDAAPAPGSATFREIAFGSDAYRQACALRDAVLRAPLGLSLTAKDCAEEVDQLHFGLFEPDGTLVACVIAVPLSQDEAKIRQMAVLASRQRQGLGAKIMGEVERVLRARGFSRLVLHARVSVAGFYRRLGYSVLGDEFIEVTIPHVQMEKPIRGEAATIHKATTASDYAAARQLIAEYQRWLGLDLEFQGFSQELETLPALYGPPSGVMLLAQVGGSCVGCVGLRRLPDGCAEMKRMFVLPAHQGQGIGRRLTQEVIAAAREMRFPAIRLDTIPRLDRAIGLYEAAGFTRIAAYRHNPDPDTLFMELRLA